MTPLTRDDIERLRELLAKATPGPFEVDYYGDVTCNGEDVARIATGDEHAPWDATLIAEALNALPALLDIAEAVANARVAWQSPRGIIQSEVDVRFDGTDTTGWKRVAVLPLAGEVANG